MQFGFGVFARLYAAVVSESDDSASGADYARADVDADADGNDCTNEYHHAANRNGNANVNANDFTHGDGIAPNRNEHADSDAECDADANARRDKAGARYAADADNRRGGSDLGHGAFAGRHWFGGGGRVGVVGVQGQSDVVIIPAPDLCLVFVAREIRERAYFCDLLDTGEEDVTPLVVFMTRGESQTAHGEGKRDESAFAGIDRE